MKLSKVVTAAALLASSVTIANASEIDRLGELEQEIREIKQRMLEKDQADQVKAEADEAKAASTIKVGGAVRFQYSYEDYDDDNRDRGGDLDLDTVRLDFNGTVSDIIFSAQYRYYQYMNVIHHADLGYQFTDNWLGKIGITQVPFGITPYNSNSFFFSTNYYLGLEDDYDSGLNFTGNYGDHEINIAYFLNDEMGGLDGYVSDRSARYSYDILAARAPGDGIYDTPSTDPKSPAGDQSLAENNTLNLRYAYHFGDTEVGASYMQGDIEGPTGTVGDRDAHAIHVKSQFDNIGVMFQYTSYEYDLDTPTDRIAVGAYAFFDTIPTSADIYNLNLSYSKPVSWGPISNLKFYNDFSLMTNKAGSFDNDTIMNVLGVAVTSGNLYTQIDFITAQNQPFIGGSLAGDADDMNSRLNVNFGYYF
jgi:hypothetical protein